MYFCPAKFLFMLKRTLIIVTLISISLVNAFAQGNEKEKKQKVYRPDIPGYFMIDLGLNFGQSLPSNFKKGVWGSRTLDLYYHYPIQIEKSHFSYNPGLGFSFQRFKFTNGYTVAQQSDGTYQLVNATTTGTLAGQSVSLKKSMLVSNYFDVIPVEFRYDTNPKDMARSFSITLGGYVGVLMESHTKIKYAENGTNIVYKNKQNNGLNPFRYGVHLRIGLGNFNFFGMYNLSPYFTTNKGPSTNGILGDPVRTTMTTMTFGISVNGL